MKKNYLTTPNPRTSSCWKKLTHNWWCSKAIYKKSQRTCLKTFPITFWEIFNFWPPRPLPIPCEQKDRKAEHITIAILRMCATKYKLDFCTELSPILTCWLSTDLLTTNKYLREPGRQFAVRNAVMVLQVITLPCTDPDKTGRYKLHYYMKLLLPLTPCGKSNILFGRRG